jgi:hypothetical protein
MQIKYLPGTVGRLIKSFMLKGLIIPSYARFKKRRKRTFKKYAVPWQYGMIIKEPGQMVQIDHNTKSLVAEIYSDATSIPAKKFLAKVIDQFPFKVQSIQVDGGMEV